MSDPASTAQRQQQRRQGLIATAISLPLRLFGVLIASLMLSILIECVGMHLFWKDQGWRHAQSMLQYELGHLSNHFTRSAIVQEPGRTAHRLVETGYEWVFVKTGLLDKMNDTAERARAPGQGQSRDFRYFISQVYVWAERRAQVRRRPGIGLRLPSRESLATATGDTALGDLLGDAGLGASTADSVTQRRLTGTGCISDCGELQKVPVAILF